MHEPSIENPVLRQYQIMVRLSLGVLICCLLLPICLHFDLAVAQQVNYQSLPGDLRTVLTCAEAFGHLYGVTLIITAIWFAAPKRRRQVRSIIILLLANSVLISLLKNSIVRVRPRGGQALQFESVWETFQGFHPIITQFDFSQLGISDLQSYPSGHASAAFVLGIGLAIIYPGARYLFLLFSCLACGQRIGYQAHYLSDVCAGTAVALMLYCIFLNTRFGRESLLGTPKKFPVLEEMPFPLKTAEKSRAA